MKDIDRWDFAQQYAGKQFMIWGFLYLLTSFLSHLIPVSEMLVQVLIGIGIMLVFCIISIVLTEAALRKNN